MFRVIDIGLLHIKNTSGIVGTMQGIL